MKYNLKNRPKPWKGADAWQYYSGCEITEWFEGFEKELRRIKELEKDYPNKDKNYAEDLVKEILGSSTDESVPKDGDTKSLLMCGEE